MTHFAVRREMCKFCFRACGARIWLVWWVMPIAGLRPAIGITHHTNQMRAEKIGAVRQPVSS